LVVLHRASPGASAGLQRLDRHVERLTQALGFGEGPLQARAAAARAAVS
jgi:hypothetical protein